jgi:hypothetical protein
MLLKEFKVEKKDILQAEKFKELGNKYGVKYLKWEDYLRLGIFEQERVFLRLGDEPVNIRKIRRIKKFNIIFSQNCEVPSENIIPVPLGLTDTSHCKLIGDLDIIVNQNKQERKYINLAYKNFNSSRRDRGFEERKIVEEKFGNKSWVTNGKFQRDKSGHAKFISEMYNHKFVLCPRGNGVDTHRLWMSLYLGTIPVVKDHIVHSAFKHLPILFVNDWDEVTEDFLNQKFEEIHSKEYDFSILKMEYWEKLFSSMFS